MKIIRYIAAALACILIIFAILFTAIEHVAYDVGFYYRQYDKLNILNASGTDEAGLAAATNAIILYLSGARDDLSVQVNVDGELRQAFLQREAQHMADVRKLFDIGRLVKAYSAMAGALLLAAAVFSGIKRSLRAAVMQTAKGMLMGAVAFACMVMLIAVWVMIDFSSFFTAFHKILFSNDLWLLDPRYELLIRLFPNEFFIACGRSIVLKCMGDVALVLSYPALAAFAARSTAKNNV